MGFLVGLDVSSRAAKISSSKAWASIVVVAMSRVAKKALGNLYNICRNAAAAAEWELRQMMGCSKNITKSIVISLENDFPTGVHQSIISTTDMSGGMEAIQLKRLFFKFDASLDSCARAVK
ncbi:hypothetical protein J3P71_09525 [Rhizobium leguminosarum]|uniref:hypothetical protein n=1 Tax=Rhizobium leguminosarum TaxID=384 RepID=UPI001441B2F7|nr:hypothetical protein [Rhizobium leguminosarum]MBY5837120.1 hypothetical protein [Rhizobium leguminosarum]NKM77664.1 hypothetical protein [Rhizobium leguminosarum bv. viciae]QSZ09969.1 hypothetical protein J3P71_09525 [Rhizobium leguminosarum]